MDIISKKAIKISDELKQDDTGQNYRETKWNYQGHRVDINIDLDDYGNPIRYHSRTKGSIKVNMDEGGLVGWFLSLFK